MTTQTRTFAPEARHYSPSAHVSISGERLVPLVIVLAILCGVSIGLAAFSYAAAGRAERESRMLQYYLLELDAKVIAAGIKKPEDAISKQLERGDR